MTRPPSLSPRLLLLQRLALSTNQLSGTLPASWASNFPRLRELALQGNELASTLPPGWVQAPGFSTPFTAALQPGNPLLCGAVAPSAGHTLLYSDGGVPHQVITTLGSCATAGCGSAAVNASAPNVFDLAWANRVAALDLQYLNPSVQQDAAPSPGTPLGLPCYPSDPPTFFGGDAAWRKATWQSSTEGEGSSFLPVSGNRKPVSAEECSQTADAPAYWMVDLQRSTQVQVRAVAHVPRVHDAAAELAAWLLGRCSSCRLSCMCHALLCCLAFAGHPAASGVPADAGGGHPRQRHPHPRLRQRVQGGGDV